MLRNYFKISKNFNQEHNLFSLFPNHFTYEKFSFNVFGLAVGMTVGLLFVTLYSYINTFDDFHKNKSLIYRVTSVYNDGKEKTSLASAPTSLADKLESESAGVSKAVRIHSNFS